MQTWAPHAARQWGPALFSHRNQNQLFTQNSNPPTAFKDVLELSLQSHSSLTRQIICSFDKEWR